MRSFHRTDKRTWSLLDDHGEVLGSLLRTKWHGMGAEIAVAQGVYEVRGMKGFTTALAVFSGDHPLRIAKSTWKGISITDPQGAQPVVVVRREHFFSSTYVISVGERSVLKVSFRMNWRLMEMQPVVVVDRGDALEPLTLLFAVHAIQVQHRRSAAAAA